MVTLWQRIGANSESPPRVATGRSVSGFSATLSRTVGGGWVDIVATAYEEMRGIADEAASVGKATGTVLRVRVVSNTFDLDS